MESDRNKAEVVATVVRFWQVYERKDLAALSNMLTTVDDFTFFGSDAAEVVKTRREWEQLMRNDWQAKGESSAEIVIRRTPCAEH